MGNSKRVKKMIQLTQMGNLCFKKWKKGKATPLDDTILKKWQHERQLKKKLKRFRKQKKEENKRVFNMCLDKCVEGKATPLDDKIKNKLEKIRNRKEFLHFKQYILKSYGLDCKEHEYSIHHLFPRQFFPSMEFDTNNVIPLTWSVHNPIHKKYHNLELAIDPIMPVIESLETAFMESK